MRIAIPVQATEEEFRVAIGGAQSYVRDLRMALRLVGDASELWYLPPMVSARRQLALRADALLSSPWSRTRAADAFQCTLQRTRLDGFQRMVDKLLAAGQPDLIHAQDAVSCQAVLRRGVPVVLTVHGILCDEQRISFGAGKTRLLAYLRELEHIAYHAADAIIAVSAHRRRYLIEQHGVDPAKITVLHNAVDCRAFAPPPDPPGADSPAFLLPRRLIKHAGVDVAIRALALLPDRDIALWIAGDGPELGALRHLTATCGVAHRVQFLGPLGREQLRQRMAGCTGVLVPTVPVEGVVEGCPIAVLEGMSMGKVVIASDCGGTPEILAAGRTGMLVPPGDVERLAAALDAVCRQPDLAAALGVAARACVLERHNLDSWVRRMQALYRAVGAR